MKVLVTGSTGFIGSHVTARLLRGGHDLLLTTTGNRLSRSGRGIQTVPFRDAHGSLDEAVIRRFRPDALLHMGWAGIPKLDLASSLENVAISARVLATAFACGVTRIVGIGSCREYRPGGGRKSEEDLPETQNDFFGQAKTSISELLSVACENEGVEWAWARPFFVYGPGQRPGALVPTAIAHAARGERIVVASPNAAVDFINVADVAEALYLLTTRPGPSGAFNIGSGRAYNVASVADWVCNEWSGELQSDLLPTSGPEAWWADINAIARGYGWTPTVTLECGIRDLITRTRS